MPGIRQKSERLIRAGWAFAIYVLFGVTSSGGQQPRMDDFFRTAPGQFQLPQRTQVAYPQSVYPPVGYQQLPSFGTVNAPGTIGPPVGVPQIQGGSTLFPNTGGNVLPPITNLPPPAQILPPNFSQPGAVIAPPFDPFNSGSNPYPFNNSPQLLNQPTWTSPVYPPNGVIFPNDPLNQPYGYGQPVQGSSGWPNSPQGWPFNAWAKWRDDYLPKLIQHLRFRQTWLEGGTDPADLDILDTELMTTMTWPNFLGAAMPLRISPGFTFHFWDGPDTAITGFDLPSQAFSAFLASDFISDPRRPAGIETNVTVGMYTDFKNVSSDSLRITGVGLGWFRINSYTTMKVGVEYYDRIDIKLLPAVGFFMQPNNDLKVDLYFPRPKITQRFPRLGNFDVWGYAGAEYGGGSWTIERMGGFDDQVDINDVRGFLGVEWMGPRGVTGFFEGGYAFNREMLYRSAPAVILENPDSFLLRAGIAF